MEKVKRTPARLDKLVESFAFEVIHRSTGFDNCKIILSDISRPALQLVGYYDHFEPKRLEILGKEEMTYLGTMSPEQRESVIDRLFSHDIPALVVTRGQEIFPEIIAMAEKHDRTLLRSEETTSDLISRITDYLNRALAPEITRHGVLMNIYGQGVLLLGDSGIGKSETAIELLKRGHRLVADDAVEIRRVSNALLGTAPEMIRHYIEIRGVGIIDVRQLFGMGAVQFETEVELVIQLEPWENGKFYDRLGLGEDRYDILGVSLPFLTVPVRPGRNLAGIVEIAVMKNRQMKYGHDAARDFINRVDQTIDELSRKNGGE